MSRYGTYDLKHGFIPDDDSPQQETPKQTNADRIRAMTDEDLAIFLDDVQKYNICCKPIICDDCADCMTDLCWQCWRDWLKQEASEYVGNRI